MNLHLEELIACLEQIVNKKAFHDIDYWEKSVSLIDLLDGLGFLLKIMNLTRYFSANAWVEIYLSVYFIVQNFEYVIAMSPYCSTAAHLYIIGDSHRALSFM